MNYFITSDTHFDHKNIIKYCNRPFITVDDMNEALIINWNKEVKKDDIVFHLGDFAFTKSFNRLKELRHELNGKIILILGNHDTTYFTPLNLLDAGIDEIYSIYECNLFNVNWVFCHYQMVSWNRSCHGSFHCFGHEHWQKQYQFNHDICAENWWSERKFNVCVDANNYKPINLLVVKEILEKRDTNFKCEDR